MSERVCEWAAGGHKRPKLKFLCFSLSLSLTLRSVVCPAHKIAHFILVTTNTVGERFTEEPAS